MLEHILNLHLGFLKLEWAHLIQREMDWGHIVFQIHLKLMPLTHWGVQVEVLEKKIIKFLQDHTDKVW